MKYNTAMPYFPEEDIREITEKIKYVLDGRGMLTMGENVALFEKEFADYLGCNYAVATNSCTSALEISLSAIGAGEGDEVIVPVQTFIATGSSVAACGATPVFCEINKDFLIDFEDLKNKITPKTKAVIVVHFAGLIHPNILEIREYLKGKEIFLIEDAAHAHGAKINDICAGNLGDVGCFSFYSTKIITTGEGGMITTNDEHIYKKCNSLRNRGLNIDAGYEIFDDLGSNRRFTEIQGIMGRCQLKRLEEFTKHRNAIAEIYTQNLKPLLVNKKIRLQEVKESMRHAYWRFVVVLDEEIDRCRVQEEMSKKGVKVDTPYTPLLHLQPIFKKLFNTKEGLLEYSEKLSLRHICLPMHCLIRESDALFISSSLISAIND